jgi:predicted ABC-type ATPase
LIERPQLWILVGGNGAGKSTYYRLALEPLGLPFVNADVLRVYDNSSAVDPFVPMFTITNDSFSLHRDPLPACLRRTRIGLLHQSNRPRISRSMLVSLPGQSLPGPHQPPAYLRRLWITPSTCATILL